MLFLVLIGQALALAHQEVSEVGAETTDHSQMADHAQRWTDANNDGLADFYVVHGPGEDRFFFGAPQGGFIDGTIRSGLAGHRETREAAFGDLDGDGRDELCLLSHGGLLQLYGQDGTGLFERLTGIVGVPLRLQGASSVRWTDYDNDGWCDLAVRLEDGRPVFLHNKQARSLNVVRIGGDRMSVTGRSWTSKRDASSEMHVVELNDELEIAKGEHARGDAAMLGRPSLPLSQMTLDAFCTNALEDVTTSTCFEASSTPSLGMLYPLGQEFSIDSFGNVGLGTASPGVNLDVIGTASISGSIEVSQGGATTSVLTDDLLEVNGDTLERIAKIGWNPAFGGGWAGLYDNQDAPGVFLRGNDSGAQGAEIEMYEQSLGNNATVYIASDEDVGISGGNQGGILLSERDGSKSYEIGGVVMSLFNGAGVQTLFFNRSTGSKSAVVSTESYGQRLFYITESPEHWFEDFGSGLIVNGVARVVLDPIFLEAVTIDPTHPLQVYVTPNGDCDGLFVDTNGLRDGFIVRERGGGKGDVDFDWRAAATRRNFEGVRLESLSEAMADEPRESRNAQVDRKSDG